MKVADLAAGVQIGNRFRLIDLLGRGSYGDVWLAEVISGKDLPSKVALKVYQQAQQSRATKVLLKEADIAQSFDDEHLVRVYGAERVDGLVIMWMEYVDGGSLYTRLGSVDAPRPVSLDDALAWLENISEGLAYLHSQDPPCVHGDLKLDNILLNAKGKAHLADFGQSRLIEDRFVATDGTGAWPYLAPEVMGRAQEGIGKRYVTSDIFSAGVVAYRLLTGRFPRRSMHEIINLTPFPKLSEINPSVPVGLEEVVLKCLEKRPENRYLTGAELLAAICQVKKALTVGVATDVDLPVSAGDMLPTVGEELIAVTRELIEDDRPEEAIDRLERAMERTSTSPRMLLIYAAAARAVGKLDAAYLVYERAIKWLNAQGASDEELRDPMEGRSELDVMLKRYDDAVEGYAWLVERWKDKRWYRYRYSVSLGLSGRYQKALEVLKALHEDGPPTALICAKIGFAYLQLRKTELAAQYFNEALMLDEYEPVALFNMARMRAIEGQKDRAMRYLDRLKQIDGCENDARRLAQMLGVR